MQKKLPHKVRSLFNVEYIKGHIAEYFLVVSLVSGLGFVVATPPFQGWDESEHFLRAYQVSEGDVLSDAVDAPNASGGRQGNTKGYGGELPSSLTTATQNLRFNIQPDDGSSNYTVFRQYLTLPLQRDERKQIRFDNTAIYSPVPYIGAAIGMSLGLVFDVGPVGLHYLGRVFHLILCILLIYAAIKIIPFGRLAMLVLTLNPVSVFLAATSSPDAFAIGLMSLILALVLRLRAGAGDRSVRYAVFLCVALTLLLLVKNIYFPVLLVVLLIPSEVLSVRYKAFAIAMPAVIALAWNIGVAHMTSMIPNYFNSMEYVNAGDQIRYILQNPFTFMKILLVNTFGPNSLILPATYNGVLAINSVPNWVIVAWTSLATLSLLVKDDNGRIMKKVLNRRLLYVTGISLLLVIGLTIGSLYIGWTPVGSSVIMGVQGRYFIAASLLLIPLVAASPIVVSSKNNELLKLIVVIIPLLLVSTIGLHAYRYIIGTI